MPGRIVALTVGGSDSSGAAGIQVDLKTLHQLRVYGASALTLISAQHGDGASARGAGPARRASQGRTQRGEVL